MSAQDKKFLELLKKCKAALDVAFGYDGDVFHIHHNDTVDTLTELEQTISEIEKGGGK